MKKFVTSTLVAIGALTVFLAGFVLLWRAYMTVTETLAGVDSNAYRIVESFPAPGGSHVATLYLIGSEDDDYCRQVLAVNPESEPFSPEVERESRRHEVFSSACRVKASPKWLSEGKLLIRLLPEPFPEDVIRMNLKTRDHTGQVSVDAEVESESSSAAVHLRALETGNQD